MNPLLAAALAKLAQKGEELALAYLTLLAKDLADGKSLQDAGKDLLDSAAEDQALLLNRLLDELDKLGA